MQLSPRHASTLSHGTTPVTYLHPALWTRHLACRLHTPVQFQQHYLRESKTLATPRPTQPCQGDLHTPHHQHTRSSPARPTPPPPPPPQVRGPGNAYDGYCVLGSVNIGANMRGSSRATAARRIRVTVDPAGTAGGPKVKVYWSTNAADANLALRLTIPVPASVQVRALTGAPDVRGDFGASTN